VLAFWPATCLIANDLQYVSNHLKQSKPAKAAVGLLGIGLILFLSVFGASPSLHKLIHAEADAPDHHCAITYFAQGQVTPAAAAQTLAVVIVLFGGVALLAETFALPTVDYCFSSSRAPPSARC
jgi:hypothetical protein